MRKTAIGQALRHLGLLGGAIFMLGPVLMMLVSSFTPTGAILRREFLGSFTLDNYATVFETVPVLTYYRNSLLVCLGTLALQLLVCTPAAFALARLRFRGRDITVAALGALVLIPFQVIAIPIYLIFRQVGLIDTLAALILPFVGSAFAIFLLRQHFLTLPSAICDAAKLDGASTAATLLELVIPSSKPAFISLSVFTITSAWNAYFWPSFALTSNEFATVPFAVISFLNSESGTAYGPQMAMAMLAVLPLLIAYLFAQRQFINGLAMGSTSN